ncbi:hypothetical protein [Amycolatopsis balhimycina]|uniref:hypothetical protein n=1 Tax=Amycolatopsis balhimycina TaxID=208443 RepID=UPI0003A875B4|nr:hypothetical protein [Amycolatopsis balhimycina]
MTDLAGTGHDAGRNDLLLAVGRVVGHGGAPVTGVRLLDAEVDVLVVADEQERRRRVAARAGSLGDLEVVSVLANLPRWEPMPLRTLSARERRVVSRAPHGCLNIEAGAVTRLVGPPLSAVLAVVHDDDWDRGLNTASRFAPVATRVLVLDREPAELPLVVDEAAEYGIGLAVTAGTSVKMLVQPECWRENYFTPGGWLFREQAYQAFAAQMNTAGADVTIRV